MQETVKQFSYTAKRSSYGIIAGVFIFLVLVEGGAIELLLALLVHLLWLKTILLFLMVGLHLYVCLMFLLPFWTKHLLTEKQLHLHYGLALNAHIPLTSIESVQVVNEGFSQLQSLGAHYDVAKQRITVCFSDQGMLLLTLHPPLMLKAGFLRRTTTSILLNVDQRNAFLNTLAAARASLVKVPPTGDEIKPGRA